MATLATLKEEARVASAAHKATKKALKKTLKRLRAACPHDQGIGYYRDHSAAGTRICLVCGFAERASYGQYEILTGTPTQKIKDINKLWDAAAVPGKLCKISNLTPDRPYAGALT